MFNKIITAITSKLFPSSREKIIHGSYEERPKETAMTEQDDFIKEVESLYQRISEADTNVFSELMEIAELDIQTDLVGANLAGTDFRGSDLSGADFAGADLTGANFSGVDLSNVNLTGAILTDVIYE